MISRSKDRLDFKLTRSIEPHHKLAASVPSLHRAPNPGDALQSDRPVNPGVQRAAAFEFDKSPPAR
jgi:hypothetical protein